MANITTDNINTIADLVASIEDGDYIYIFKGGTSNSMGRIERSVFMQMVADEVEVPNTGVSVSYNASKKTTRITIGASAAPSNISATPAIVVEDIVGGKKVTISGASGSTIYFTTDGNDPTATSQVYSAAFNLTVAGSYTIKAVAKQGSKPLSDVTQEEITLSAVSSPVITSSEGSSATTITATRSGATVYISSDNTNWESGSDSASLTIQRTSQTQSVTVYAYAVKSGYVESLVVTSTVTISEIVNKIFSGTSSSAIPAITINGTTYTDTQSDSIPYIENTAVDGGYEWSIDFGGMTFSESIKYGNNATKSIFSDSSYDYNSRVKTITHMPSSWGSLGSYAFYCPNLTSIVYGSNLTKIDGALVLWCQKLVTFSGLPATLGTISRTGTSSGAILIGSGSITTSVNIPDTVQLLGSSVFYNCSSITSAYVDANTIGNYVFQSTSNRTITITFGPHVASIGTGITYGRIGAITIVFEKSTPPSFSNQAKFLFDGAVSASSLTIKVPQGSLSAYQSALSSWEEYIEEVSE